jgi:hypothetical protein
MTAPERFALRLWGIGPYRYIPGHGWMRVLVAYKGIHVTRRSAHA